MGLGVSVHLGACWRRRAARRRLRRALPTTAKVTTPSKRAAAIEAASGPGRIGLSHGVCAPRAAERPRAPRASWPHRRAKDARRCLGRAASTRADPVSSGPWRRQGRARRAVSARTPEIARSRRGGRAGQGGRCRPRTPEVAQRSRGRDAAAHLARYLQRRVEHTSLHRSLAERPRLGERTDAVHLHQRGARRRDSSRRQAQVACRRRGLVRRHKGVVRRRVVLPLDGKSREVQVALVRVCAVGREVESGPQQALRRAHLLVAEIICR